MFYRSFPRQGSPAAGHCHSHSGAQSRWTDRCHVSWWHVATHVATHGHRHGNPWLPWLPWRQMISTGDLLIQGIQALHQWIYMGKPAKTTRNHMGKPLFSLLGIHGIFSRDHGVMVAYPPVSWTVSDKRGNSWAMVDFPASLMFDDTRGGYSKVVDRVLVDIPTESSWSR